MATTYNNNLRIAEIGTGDQAGVWGNTTNYNLATLLTEAITGVISVTVATSTAPNDKQALSALDGVTDQARQAALILGGTPPAAFTLFVPPTDKIYIIRNNTGQSATISVSTLANGTTATGGTTVTIPTGFTAFLYSDGNNIADGVSFFSANSQFGGTGSLGIPAGTTGQRSGTGIRYNTTFGQYEGFDANTSQWNSIGGGATGGAGNQVFFENSPLVTASYTLTSGKNATTAGPMQVISIQCIAKIDNGSGLAGTTLTVPPLDNASSFTGSVSGTTLTASSVTGTIGLNQFINGTNVLPYTQIVSQLTGTTGGAGTYKLNISQTVGSTTITTIASGVLYVGAVVTGTGISAGTTITAFGTGTGGSGTYTVNTSQLATLTTVTSAVAVTVPDGQRLVVL